MIIGNNFLKCWLLILPMSIRFTYGCIMYNFVPTDDGKALEDHVIKTITEPNIIGCWKECVWLSWCFTINVRQTGEGMFECELNNSTKKAKPSKMASRKGWSYHEMKDLGQKNCKNYQCIKKEDLGDRWFRFGESAFKLFTEKKNWKDARSHCQSLGGDLLSITSSLENDFVNDVLGVEKLNLTYMQEDKKFTVPHMHFKLNGDKAEEVMFKGNNKYKMVEGEKVLYLDGNEEVDSEPINLDPALGFTLLFWFKPIEVIGAASIFAFKKDGVPLPLRFRFESGVNALKLTINLVYIGEFKVDESTFYDWQHVFVSWEKGTATILGGKNGKIQFTVKNQISSIDTTNIILRFGNAGSNKYHGFFKHLVLVNGAVSRHKVQTIMYWYEQGVWIGLNNPEGSAGFRWSDGTTVGQFMNLPDYNPEPTLSLRKCVAMAKGKKWLDKHCDLKYPFLCEKPAP